MQRLVLILFLAGIATTANTQAGTAAAEACTDEAVMRVNGSWKKRQDALMQPGNQAAVHSRIDNISTLFLATYPSPKGIEAGWYRTMTRPMFTNGPSAYAYNSLYFSWYCNKNFNRLMLGGETRTWAYVFVNYFSWFLNDTLHFRVNGQRVYYMPEPIGEWKGHPLYDAPAHSGDGRCIVLIRKGEARPWTKVTQQQYLEGLRRKWMGLRQEAAAAGGKTIAGYQKSIAEIRKNQFLPAHQREKVIADLQKRIGEFQKRRSADSAKNTGYWNDKIAVIDNYLSATPAATLQLPARVLQKEINDFKGAFTKEPKSAEFVTVNTAYFNKQSPAAVPQLMVLYWRWSNNAPAHDFKEQFESNFPVEQLQAMIDK